MTILLALSFITIILAPIVAWALLTQREDSLDDDA